LAELTKNKDAVMKSAGVNALGKKLLFSPEATAAGKYSSIV